MSSKGTASWKSDRRLPVEGWRFSPGASGNTHAWAFAGDTPGKMLIAFAPANKMEEYFRSFKPRGGTDSNWNDPQDIERSHAYGIDLLGPPLSLE